MGATEAPVGQSASASPLNSAVIILFDPVGIGNVTEDEMVILVAGDGLLTYGLRTCCFDGS